MEGQAQTQDDLHVCMASGKGKEHYYRVGKIGAGGGEYLGSCFGPVKACSVAKL